MGEAVAQILVVVFLVYLGVGVLVAIPFVSVGVQRVDAAARGSGPLFRVLILPGCAGLWPVVAWKWLRSRGDA